MFDLGEGILDFDEVFDFMDDKADYSLSTESEDTTNGSESNDTILNIQTLKPKKAKTKKRKRSARYPNELIPRLLIGDIRRSFANMFINSLNALDIGFFFEFLSTYATPSVSYSQETPGYSDLRIFELIGITSICQLFYNKMSIAPDSVHSIPGYCSVITRPDGTSEIVTIMHLKATRLFDVGFEYVVPKPCNNTSSVEELRIVNKTTNKCVGVLDGSIIHRVQQLPALAEPITMVCTVQLAMYLNERKQIERFALTLPRNEAVVSAS